MSDVAIRPLLARPGARFACSGHGLCCTDIHLLGPLSRAERARVEHVRPRATRAIASLSVLDTVGDGHCTFLAADGCDLHRAHGAASKPAGCRRFPYFLVATPDGGRVGTDHRCPCRTMGARPALDLDDAARSLSDAGGRVRGDRRVPRRIPMSERSRVGWRAYRRVEDALLAQLAHARGPEVIAALGAPPFATLTRGTWADVAHAMAPDELPMRWARANEWVASFIRTLTGSTAREPPPRPWAPSFARASGATARDDAQDPFADFAADYVWSLEWLERGSFAQLRSELATRVAIGLAIAALLERDGARSDAAAAEAIAIIETAGLSDGWCDVVPLLVV